MSEIKKKKNWKMDKLNRHFLKFKDMIAKIMRN